MENLSLGFRPPHFSEDLAWLPSWLQPHTVNEHINEQNPTEQQFEELFFPPQNTSMGEDTKMSSGEEARYNSFRLFLSAEDNSLLTSTPTSENASTQMVHFHLHLSPTGDSESIPSLLVDTSCSARFESTQILVMQQLESSSLSEEKTNRCKMGHNLVPQEEKSDNLIPQSLGNNNNNGVKNEENVGFLKVADIDDAVELCISASETPIIHEVMKSGLATKSLLASSALEVALRLKQARLQGSGEACYSSNDEISDVDYVSDLDESAMVDAYEDVGLSVNDYHGSDSNISHVKDTYGSEDYALGAKSKYKNDLRRMEVHSGDIGAKQQSKGVEDADIQLKNDSKRLEFLDGDRKNSTDDPDMLHQFVHASPSASMTEKIDLVANTPIQATLNSSRAKSSENIGRDEMTNSGPERFQSRWLGGWASKEVDASAPVQHNNIRSIRDFFVGETSFLSESADIAPDENSVVHKNDRGTNMASQSSVPFDGSHRKDDEEILFHTPSFVDPLCSVVSCSISSANGCSNLPPNNKDEADAGNCFIPTTELTEFVSGDSSQPTVRRQVTSLGIYSTLLPSCGPYLENEFFFPDSSFPVKHDVIQSPVTGLMNEMRNYEATIKDEAVLPINNQHETGKSSSLILSHGENQFFHDFKSFLSEFSGDENPKGNVVPGKDLELFQSKNVQKVDSKYRKSRDDHVPVRKRVRFSEPESQFPQNIMMLQELQTTATNRNRSSTRTSKNDSVEEVKMHIMKHRDKDSKKRLIMFQNIDFLLTGFTSKKEKEIEGLIRKHGGDVLSDIPFPTLRGKRITRSKKCQPLPIILCSKKLQTTKFLFGCAVNTFILTVNWLIDSIGAGFPLLPDKYLILPNRAGEKCKIGKPVVCHNHRHFFDTVGIMLHGKPNFCTKMAKVVKHGGGLVFKTLQWLVNSIDNGKIYAGAIVAEDESRVSRHLKQCASERKIAVVPVNWIIKSLHVGRLIPFADNYPLF
ncbi:hypothetical protein LguiB_024108 [Lonicera macranthoides]